MNKSEQNIKITVGTCEKCRKQFDKLTSKSTSTQYGVIYSGKGVCDKCLNVIYEHIVHNYEINLN